jgi:hypothetical protein
MLTLTSFMFHIHGSTPMIDNETYLFQRLRRTDMMLITRQYSRNAIPTRGHRHTPATAGLVMPTVNSSWKNTSRGLEPTQSIRRTPYR